MKKCVLTTIVATILGCSLLLAEDATTQQIQPAMCQGGSKMTCCKMKNCKAIEARSEKAVVKLQAKAQEFTKLAELFTNCANARQKVADAAKALVGCDCMGSCKANNDSSEESDMKKKCEDLCSKLIAAQEEAAQADSALKDYRKANRKTL